MKILLLCMAFASWVQADLDRALKLLSRCQPETRHLDICGSPKETSDDADLEAQKDVMSGLNGFRFFIGKRRWVK